MENSVNYNPNINSIEPYMFINNTIIGGIQRDGVYNCTRVEGYPLRYPYDNRYYNNISTIPRNAMLKGYSNQFVYSFKGFTGGS